MSEPCAPLTLARDRRYSQYVSRPVYEHVTSSFSLNQDVRSVPDAGSLTQSAADYRPCTGDCRPRSPAERRPPASIFHEDERCLDGVQSEMLRCYVPHPRPTRDDDEDFYNKYRATTYKRHADPRFQVRTWALGCSVSIRSSSKQKSLKSLTRSHPEMVGDVACDLEL